MEPIIKVENLHFTYPTQDQETLRGIDLEIMPGTFTAVLGHNGSGKSTLAKHFNAIFLPTEGTVRVCGMDTKDEELLLGVRATVGMVFQNPDNQIVANVVEDDVAFAPENLGVPPEEIRERVDAALKQVGMYEFRSHAPHLLSGGSGRREVIETVTRLCREKGITVILITHHMDECVGADRLIVMSGGKIVLDGRPKDVFQQSDVLLREGLAVPTTTALLQALKSDGMDVPTDALAVNDCADAIAAALKS